MEIPDKVPLLVIKVPVIAPDVSVKGPRLQNFLLIHYIPVMWSLSLTLQTTLR